MALNGNHSVRHHSDHHQSRRRVSSPWNHVVRVEPDTTAASPSSLSSVDAIVEPPPSVVAPVDESSCSAESSDKSGGNDGGSVKRPAWNKSSSNGAASSVVKPPVMDGVSWPALSDSARSSAKPESSSKGFLDGTSDVPQFQGTGSMPSSSRRQVSDSASTSNMAQTHQKSSKHNSSNPSINGGHPQQSAPHAAIGSHNSSTRDHTQRSRFSSNGSASTSNMAQTRQNSSKHNSSNASTSGGHPQQSAPHAAIGSHNSSHKDHTQRSGFASNDHPQQRNSFRNRNDGPHQRGNGAHHHSYGNRRHQDWNTHRSFNGKDSHMPSTAVPRIIRQPPPPNSAPFIHPPPVRPFGSPFGFNELAPLSAVVFVPGPPQPPDSLRVPFLPPMPPLFFTGPDLQLHTKIVNQIDYYFSNDNLIKDTFLRQNMDSQGWVPIKLIAGFNQVMHLTDNIQLILDAVRTSSVVEVQGDKIRTQNDWRKWILPPSVQLPNVKGSQTLGMLNHDMLAEQVQSIALESTNYDED
ncbi:putative winged helix-turn-helix DNA-binding domain-containing protein [Lupinus albus]|uniref:Putative winged helix-turn-helix DNA-binding domain-containing protein n=1 Tax=Lupinus albus TaxID=3870 RepID=A0A6A4PY54_LUPAL|nr:putative winged helix-turn-helix DNA-binding domain-containing protein [Lupinus albus]